MSNVVYNPSEWDLNAVKKWKTERVVIAGYFCHVIIEGEYSGAILNMSNCGNHIPHSIRWISGGFMVVCENCNQIQNYTIGDKQ